jgi:HlyD family secretion protein
VPETNAPSPVPRAAPSLFAKPTTGESRAVEPSAVEPMAGDPTADDTVAIRTVAVDPGAAGPSPVDATDDATELISSAPAPRTRHRRTLTPREVVLRRVLRTAVPTVLVAATLVACTTSSGPPPPPTARVERTNVTTAVSSAGSLTAVTERNLGFLRGGQIKTVDVKVGQKVTAGEVLATVDDAPARRALEQQQGQLASQQAALTRLVNATTVTGAENTTNQAGEILDATQDQADATEDAASSAVDQAERQLDFDQDALDDIDDQLDQAEKACGSSGGASSGGGSIDLSGILGQSDSDDDGDDDSAEERKKRLEAALKAAGSLAGSLVSSASSSANPACAQVATLQSAQSQAERQVEADRNAVDQAQNQVDVNEATGRVQVENARQGLVTAQNNLDAAVTDRPSLIAQQRGLVATAQAAVAAAQKDVDDTVLRAPADGTVAALNGAVGEVLAPSASTTPLAPGSEGAIPGAGTSTNATGGVVTRPGGTQFLVLDNVDTFEVVVPFEESDAVRMAPNQRVDVRFDAVPDLTLPGNVVAVSPSASALSGVISYYVTVGLSQSDPRLRNGLTAQASVVTDELRDVLAVPNSAIRRQGGRTQVTVQRFDGPQVVEITTGVVGDTYTQVLSGLSVGDEVVLPDGR